MKKAFEMIEGLKNVPKHQAVTVEKFDHGPLTAQIN